MRRLLALLFFTITLGMAQGAYAGPHEDALAAYNRGDYATALRLWKPLATRGDSWAQANIGTMYNYGNGVAQDHKEAVRWYRLAAVQGNELGQLNLGASYFTGRGITQDYVRAYMWWNLSLANGYSIATEKLNTVAGKMTHAQIAQAKEMARRCQQSNYKNCD